MGRPLLFAQISDVHLGPITGFSPRYWNAKRAVGYLNWLRARRHAYSRALADRLVADAWTQGADHLLVTGDLVNLGLPGELAAATRWLESVGSPDRVSVIPGNHDIYSRIGPDAGVARWNAYMTSNEAGRAFAGHHDPFPYVRCFGPVALVAVNSAVETPPAIATGHVGPRQLAHLGDVLAATGAAGLFRLVMIHHPPLPGQARPSRALTDAADVALTLERHGAELVIHGHNHRRMLSFHGARAMPVVGAPSGSLRRSHGSEPLASYHIYRITTGGPRTSVDLVVRGIVAPDGPVVDLERRALVPAPAPADRTG
jgi:3',5'-cyclic AMP phosphodiesterase CpdA